VDDVDDKVTLVTVQVSEPPFEALAVTPAGTVMFCITVALADAVHPLTG
jgi:hypothetical protein